KIAASRQRGKWTGGTPILGYDVDRSGGSPKLVINLPEASQVRQIFELYLELGSLLPVVQELERRKWRCKAWTTRGSKPRGGLTQGKACGRVMSHTFTGKGNRRYRYYTCTNAVKRGRSACPTASLPASEIEQCVVDQIRCIGHDPELLGDTLKESRAQADAA